MLSREGGMCVFVLGNGILAPLASLFTVVDLDKLCKVQAIIAVHWMCLDVPQDVVNGSKDVAVGRTGHSCGGML